MTTYTITNNDKEALEDFFSKESYENIDTQGYYTLAAEDDDEFIAGVIQFYIGEDAKDDVIADITYLYVDTEFRNQGVGTVLLAEFKNIISSAGITLATAQVPESAGDEIRDLLTQEGFEENRLSAKDYLFELKLPEGTLGDKALLSELDS